MTHIEIIVLVLNMFGIQLGLLSISRSLLIIAREMTRKADPHGKD